MKVADIMSKQVVKVRNAASIATAITLMREHKIHALIVERTHPEDAYGIITATDIVARVLAHGRDPASIRVYEVMSKPCIVLNPNLGLEYAARLLTKYGIHSAPVIQKELLGILSLTDILDQGNILQRSLETELNEQIQVLTNTAQTICQTQGSGTPACAEAWAAVDTLQAELAHQRQEKLEQTASEAFRERYPDALTPDDYEIWCSG